jgi:hypothetical protein
MLPIRLKLLNVEAALTVSPFGFRRNQSWLSGFEPTAKLNVFKTDISRETPSSPTSTELNSFSMQRMKGS